MKENLNEKKIEKIFLSDLPLTDRFNDEFQSKQVSQLLKQSIEQSQLPLHISLLGKWGSGKTTVIKMLEDELDNKKYEMKIISVWKFADDAPSLHRKIVREVERKLSLENPENMDVSTTIEESLQANGVLSAITLLKKMGNFKSIILLNFIIFILLILLQIVLPSEFSPIAMNSLTLLIISLATAFLAKNSFGIIASIKNVKTNLPLNFGDQYENRFRRVVDQYLGKKTDKKLILVFDDLDRLPPKQLYGALNTIKTFLSSKRCAFIIPCDEGVLKEELKEAFGKKEMRSFDVNEYLNKTFDITIRLPKLEPLNMKKYAKSILEKEKIIWHKENSGLINELLAILIHSEVLTPRHVKKNLNAFSTDWELAKKRDSINRNGKFLTSSPLIIAVFSVLKSDFNKFYDEIIDNPFLIREVTEKPPSERSEILKGLKCDDLDNLAGFLSKIEDLVPNDPRPFIYFNNEELNPLTGRVDLEEVKKFVLNGQGEEIKKKMNKNNINDLRLVFSSVLSDISSSIEIKKFFSILFYYPEFANYIDEKDKVAFSELVKHNLESVSEFSLINVLKVFEKNVTNSVVWKRFGQVLEDKNKYGQLVEAHIDNYKLVDKLQIDSIYSAYVRNAIEIGEYNEDYYFVPKLIMSLPMEHPIVSNLNWYNTLLTTLNDTTGNEINEDVESKKNSKKNVLDFNLANWLNAVELKSKKLFTVKDINEILKCYNFTDYESLQNIVDFWLLHFRDDEVKQLGQLLILIENHIAKITTDEELQVLGKIVSRYDSNGEVLKAVEKLISNLYEEIELEELEELEELTDFIRITNALSNTSYVAEFTIAHFSFTYNPFNQHLLRILVNRANFYSEEALIELLNKASNEIFEPANLNGILLLAELIKESNIWLSTAKKFKQTWFNLSDDSNFWLKWDVNDEEFEELMDIYYQLYKDEENVWELLIDSVKYFASYNDNYHNIPYRYKHLWKQYVNKGFNFIVDNCDLEDDWIVALDKFHSIQSVYNSSTPKSIFGYLEQESISNFVAKVPKVVSFDNSDLNDILCEYAQLKNVNHLFNVINRWGFFTKEQRIELTASIPIEKGERLLKHVTENAEMKYIEEIADYNLDEKIKEKIMFAIVKNVDTFTINQWIEETLDLFINSDENSWRLSAFKHALMERNDIEKPSIVKLERLFDFKDERTNLAFEMVLKLFPKTYRNKTEFKEIRRRILLLESDNNFREYVFDAKEKYGWRNNVLV
ncbi:P-loop NTPase fold protein [Heyndrickxia oleronia]|uniref:P-loop NTPase fold protein n=1 Tax=Heyndrickxia oleronia TaxID=38875 RepID=UPI003F26F597